MSFRLYSLRHCRGPAKPPEQHAAPAGGLGAGSVFLIASGTASTLLSKTLLNMRVPALRKSGRTKLKAFRKPGAATLFMFLGCFLVLPLAPLVHWLQRRLAARSRRGSSSGSSVCGNGNGGASEPLLADGATEQQPARTAAFVLHQAALVAIPTCFTVVATATHKVALMWLHLSVYQMLRGCQIVFTALLAATFLGRRLTRWHAGGLSLTVAGILLVGLAGVLGAKEAAPFEASLGLTLAAMALIVVSEAIHAVQLTLEDQFISQLHFQPLTIVGLEGLLGAALMLTVVLPIMQVLPGPGGRGVHEDSRETLHMLAASAPLRRVAAAYIGAGGLFNLAGMLMTGSVGAVFRTLLEALRTLTVWLLDLAIWYAAVDGKGEHRFGEPWTRASWLQVAGFACMVGGTAVYSHGRALQDAEQAAAAAASVAAGSSAGDRSNGAIPAP